MQFLDFVSFLWVTFAIELRIRDVYPGSEVFHPWSRVGKDPGSGSALKNLSIFDPKNFNYALEIMIRDGHLDFSHPWIRIPDPGVKKLIFVC
jgi:hypothetical protein